ncbi:hypothetical protein SprV_0401654000 [Sparganum proliferum]
MSIQKTWEDLTQNRPGWRKPVKTDAAIYEARRIAVTKAKRANHPPLPTGPRCQRAFRGRIGLIEHLRIQSSTNLTTFISSPALAPAANPTPTANHTVAAPPPPYALSQTPH